MTGADEVNVDFDGIVAIGNHIAYGEVFALGLGHDEVVGDLQSIDANPSAILGLGEVGEGEVIGSEVVVGGIAIEPCGAAFGGEVIMEVADGVGQHRDGFVLGGAADGAGITPDALLGGRGFFHHFAIVPIVVDLLHGVAMGLTAEEAGIDEGTLA